MARLPMLLRNGSATSRGVLGSRNSVLVSRIYDNISTTCRTCFVGQSRRGTVYFYQACSQRQLSSSSALTNKDRNDGEFFTATQTFDSEYSSSGVDASVTDVLAQTEDFAALGLGGYSPSGLLQSLLEFLHVNAHLPWWASIAAATITLRLLLFPLALHMRRDAAKMANISPITSKINERIVAYRRIGNNLAVAEEWKKQQSIFNQHGVNPSRTFMMSFAQLPVFVSFLMAIRGMANLPLESMKTGGLYWFTDLTVPDPTYTLPLMACLAFISNIELGGEGGAPSSNEIHRNVKTILRVSAIAVIPFTITFPSGVLVYWVTNSLYSTCQILFLKIPLVQRLFGIPKIETPPEDNS